MNLFFKTIGHFRTVTRHRHMVIRHAFKAGILWQGLFHDLSKYSPTEFIPSVKNYKDGKRSPNEAERLSKGYSSAWLHHKGRNRHHFEYWTDYSMVTKKLEPVEMPLKYVKEMFCDRVAASKIYQGKAYTDQHPLEYFGKAKKTRYIHPATAKLLESWLIYLSEHGEKETFRMIKKYGNKR